MKKYFKPVVKTTGNEFLFIVQSQYVVNLSQCPGVASSGVSISLQDSETGIAEACDDSDPPAGLGFTIQCAETGSTEYVWTMSSFQTSSSASCTDPDVLYTLFFDIDPSMPSECTVTSLSSEGTEEQCDEDQITIEQ